VLASGAISMGLIGPFAGGMSDRRGMQRTLAIGLGLLTVGVSGFILLPSAIANPEWHIRFISGIVVMQSIIGCGSTFFSASNTNSCLHSVSSRNQPAIAGLLSVNLMAGSALGSTLAGEYFSMIGGITHVHSETAQNAALVFPPHAFSWLFGACAAWLLILTLIAWRRIQDKYGDRTDFVGAHLVGSLHHMPLDAPFAAYRDVDLAIILDSITEQEIDDALYEGLILEAIVVPASRYESAEQLLGDACNASILAGDHSILLDQGL